MNEKDFEIKKGSFLNVETISDGENTGVHINSNISSSTLFAMQGSKILSALINAIDKKATSERIAKADKYAMIATALDYCKIDIDELYEVAKDTEEVSEEVSKKVDSIDSLKDLLKLLMD